MSRRMSSYHQKGLAVREHHMAEEIEFAELVAKQAREFIQKLQMMLRRPNLSKTKQQKYKNMLNDKKALYERKVRIIQDTKRKLATLRERTRSTRQVSSSRRRRSTTRASSTKTSRRSSVRPKSVVASSSTRRPSSSMRRISRAITRMGL